MDYKFDVIEKKWQDYWEKNKTFKRLTSRQQKLYVLDMFPYPSGADSTSDPEGYPATDIQPLQKTGRYNVLHRWDGMLSDFRRTVCSRNRHASVRHDKKNIDTFRRQIKSLGSATTGTGKSTY
jgi:leucyl-tRNA synthetase